MSHQPRLYAAPNFLEMGISYRNLSSLSAKFHYVKNSQWQSCSAINCLSSGINILTGVAPFPWYLNAKGPTPLEASALHTLRLIARQPWRHCVTSLRSAHWLASSLKLAARLLVKMAAVRRLGFFKFKILIASIYSFACYILSISIFRANPSYFCLIRRVASLPRPICF